MASNAAGMSRASTLVEGFACSRQRIDDELSVPGEIWIRISAVASGGSRRSLRVLVD
jgi:hypothetical protein